VFNFDVVGTDLYGSSTGRTWSQCQPSTNYWGNSSHEGMSFSMNEKSKILGEKKKEKKDGS